MEVSSITSMLRDELESIQEKQNGSQPCDVISTFSDITLRLNQNPACLWMALLDLMALSSPYDLGE